MSENIETKSRNKVTVKKQIKQLEELAQKYSEESQKYKKKILKERKEIDPLVLIKENSRLPIKKTPPKLKVQKLRVETPTDDKPSAIEIKPNIMSFETGNEKNEPAPKPSSSITKPKTLKFSAVDKQAKEKREVKVKKIENKERTMSLDSLDVPDVSVKTCQSIGINTELLCVPCVIHENAQETVSNKRNLDEMAFNTSSSSSLPKIELLYKNLTMVSSSDIQARDSFTMDTTPSEIQNISSEISFCNVNKVESYRSELQIEIKENTSGESNCDLNDESHNDNAQDEIQHNLSGEKFEDNYEHDLSDENFEGYVEDKIGDTEGTLEAVLQSRHGSSETYTKFTENPADLEEFINATDKLMNSQTQESFNSSDLCQDLHTPTATSIENINKDSEVDLAERTKVSLKHSFSDTLTELKDNFKELLKGAGVSVEEAKQTVEKRERGEATTIRKLDDLEHIILFEKGSFEELPAKENDSMNEKCDGIKLPSIAENNKPDSKIPCTNKRMQRIYKPNSKFKMLSEHSKGKTYIFRENLGDSDSPSTCSDAPPLKLPRVDNKKQRSDWLAFTTSRSSPTENLKNRN